MQRFNINLLEVFFFYYSIAKIKAVYIRHSFSNECSHAQRWFLKSILMYTKTKKAIFKQKQFLKGCSH